MSSGTRTVVWIAVIVAAAAALSFVGKKYAPPERVPWTHDVDLAMSESRRTGKPVFAYFTADWCGPCQALKTTTWADPAVEAAMKSVVPLKLDVDDYPDLAERYQVTSIPTVLLLASDGELVAGIDASQMQSRPLIDWVGRWAPKATTAPK